VATGTSKASGQKNQLPALTKVVYPDLWQGINLVYESKADGIAESTLRSGFRGGCIEDSVALQRAGGTARGWFPKPCHTLIAAVH
jgi:hypothetical protein